MSHRLTSDELQQLSDILVGGRPFDGQSFAVIANMLAKWQSVEVEHLKLPQSVIDYIYDFCLKEGARMQQERENSPHDFQI